MRKKPYTFLLLALLAIPLLNSTLLFSSVVSVRIPAYLTSVGFVILSLVTKGKSARFAQWPAALSILFLIGSFVSFFTADAALVATNIRQSLFYGVLFFCGLVGYAFYTESMRRRVDPVFLMINIHSGLFIYGIYTYFAQVYDLPEFFSFLRSPPDTSATRITVFSGWASANRAYSVWYEPSYSGIVIAATLPLLFLSNDKKFKILFLFFGAIFSYFTYSRTSWLIFGLAILGYYPVKMLSRVRSLIPGILILLGIIVITIAANAINPESIGSDISVRTRFNTTTAGLEEYKESPIFGLGTPTLSSGIHAGDATVHIHNSFVGMMHWHGIIGLLIMMLPFSILIWKMKLLGAEARSKKSAAWSFCILCSVAMSLGGFLVALSTFWFFWGFFCCVLDNDRQTQNESPLKFKNKRGIIGFS
ncbi:O-antigen ligase family protein [Solimonas soli]|uniref:O-antigen ligase family protein n=1 Tax=Solimonas soli TaxID=413479 RepID=UPI00146FA4B7|nr:O-antigen ligase family protein [Solimonas soli]